MNSLLCACFGLAMIGGVLHAQGVSPYQAAKTVTTGVEFHNSNYGIFGLNIPLSQSGFIYPSGSSNTYIFGAGIWFGCVKQYQGSPRPVSILTYNPNSGSSWAVPGEYGVTPPPAPFFTSAAFDHGTGAYTGTLTTTEKWPLWLTPNMVPTPMSEGVYEPNNALRTASDGGYSTAAFLPYVDEQQVARFNDGDIAHYEKPSSLPSGLYPIGLQMQQTTYAWKSSLLKGTVLVHYRIQNVSGDTLRQCVVGDAVDPDLGNASNDHGRFYSGRPDLRSVYFWTGTEHDQYGALVLTLVEAPVTDDQGFIRDADRIQYHHDGRIGACDVLSIEEDPADDVERYQVMTSGRIDSVGVQAGDYRLMLSSRTFNMRPGDVAHFTVAYSVVTDVPEMSGAPGATASAVDALVEPLLRYYYSPTGFQGVAAVPAEKAEAALMLAVAPNPVRESARIRFNGDGRSPMRLRVVDLLGREMLDRDLGTPRVGVQEVQLDCPDYAPGVYFVKLQSDDGTAIATPLVITR